ncbi:MAG: hypothetical protein LBC65_03920 [Oscillospiraceae bacterium]|nr:hypothetical protein [Oscillospiraceae bacterium]
MAKREEISNSASEWNSLYNITTKLFRIAPWGEYTADSFFSICDEESNEYFLSFNNGIHCLPGVDGLRSYIRMLHNRGDELIEIALRSIAITRSKEGLEYKSYLPGYVPWSLNDYEVKLLHRVYGQAIPLIEWVANESPMVDYTKLESPTRRYDQKRREWVHEVRRLQLPPIPPKVIELPDEMTLYRIANRHSVNAILEIDVFTIMKQSTEEGYDRPFYPTMIIIAEQSRNVVLDVKLVPPGGDIPEETIEAIIEFIEKHGRPTLMFVQAQETYGMLYGFAEEVKLPLRVAGFLSAVNYYKLEKGIDT